MPLNLKEWDKLPTEYRWAAQDADGTWCAYTVIPETMDNHWWYEAGGKCAEIDLQDPPNPNWESTLIIRDYVLPQWDQVPDWTNYLAQDANGDWYAYKQKPEKAHGLASWVSPKDFARIFTAAPNPGWKLTLQERANMQTPNQPNWDKLPEWANWVAQDADGAWYAYERKPSPTENGTNMWAGTEGPRGKAQKLLNTAKNWKNTLQERPKPEMENYYFWGIR